MEYESRRDADDAYHEMHNKRIGRDDVLKVEVGSFLVELISDSRPNPCSGLVLLRPPRGDSILAVIVVVTVHRLVVTVRPPPAAAVTTRLAAMIAVTGTTTAVTAIETVIGTVIVLGALMTATVIVSAIVIATVSATAIVISRMIGIALTTGTASTTERTAPMATTERVWTMTFLILLLANSDEVPLDPVPPAHDELDTAE